MSRSHAEEIARLISMVDERTEFIPMDDGYLCYAPTGNDGGLSAWMLRAIADELDRRNAPHDADIARYFAAHPAPANEGPFE